MAHEELVRTFQQYGRTSQAMVFLADLDKAFERVATQWLLLCFACWQPPEWLFRAVTTLVSGRRSQFKIGRRLGGLLYLLRGLDMGSAASPWFFCLALDPLLRMLRDRCQIHSTAYMDDLT